MISVGPSEAQAFLKFYLILTLQFLGCYWWGWQVLVRLSELCPDVPFSVASTCFQGHKWCQTVKKWKLLISVWCYPVKVKLCVIVKHIILNMHFFFFFIFNFHLIQASDWHLFPNSQKQQHYVGFFLQTSVQAKCLHTFIWVCHPAWSLLVRTMFSDLDNCIWQGPGHAEYSPSFSLISVYAMANLLYQHRLQCTEFCGNVFCYKYLWYWMRTWDVNSSLIRRQTSEHIFEYDINTVYSISSNLIQCTEKERERDHVCNSDYVVSWICYRHNKKVYPSLTPVQKYSISLNLILTQNMGHLLTLNFILV